MELLEKLNWRYATKKYIPREVDQKDIAQILEAINLTASSCGLQPYRVFAIQNKEIRTQLAIGSFNTQIQEASHLLVFAGMDHITQDYIEQYLEMAEKQRGLPKGAMGDLKTKLISYFSTQSQTENRIWGDKQAYIGLGTALIAAAELKLDSTPMEGFDHKQVEKVLGLPEKGLHATVMLSIGYRDAENDFLAPLNKVRLPINEFSIELK